MGLTHASGVPCLRLFTAAGTVHRLAIVPSSALLSGHLVCQVLLLLSVSVASPDRIPLKCPNPGQDTATALSRAGFCCLPLAHFLLLLQSSTRLQALQREAALPTRGAPTSRRAFDICSALS